MEFVLYLQGPSLSFPRTFLSSTLTYLQIKSGLFRFKNLLLRFFKIGMILMCFILGGSLTQGTLKGCNVLTVGYKAFF